MPPLAMLLRLLPPLLLAFPLLAAAETTADVDAYLAAHQAEWRRAMPAQGSRLFYLESQWPALRQAVDAAPARWRDAFFAAADRIVASPLPAYEPPEARVGRKGARSLFDAQQELWQRDVGDDLVALSLAARLRDDPRYRQRLHDEVLAACAFDTWGRNGQPNIDLACAHLSRGVAVAWDWNRALFSPEERARIVAAVRERSGALYRAWAGNGWWAGHYAENHNQVDAAGMGLAGLAFYDDIPEAPRWLAAAMLDYRHVAEAANADGSSSEGVPYWTYGVSFVLQFIEGTRQITGADAWYDRPFLRNAASYRIGMATPGFGSLPPWGDALPRDFYGPQHLLYRLAARYRDGGAQYMADRIPLPPQGGNDVYAWTLLWCDPSIPPVPPAFLDYHAADWDVATTRSGWSDADYFVSLKAGFANRNHSHLDIGALCLSFGDEWLIRTPGYGKGGEEAAFWNAAKTRWDYFSTSTESHSTLLVDGKNPRFDREARGTISRFLSAPGECWIDADLTRTYDGPASVRRRLFHRRGSYLLVLDDVASPNPARVEWLLQAGPDARADGSRLSLPGKKGSLGIQLLGDGDSFALRAPTRPHVDIRDPNQTFAAAREGARISFSVLMVPRRAGGADSRIAATLASDDASRTVTLRGPGWEDRVVVALRAAPIPMAGGSAVAEAAACRTAADGTPQAWSLLGATDIALPPLRLHSVGAPCDAAVEADPAAPGAWTLDLSTPFQGTLGLPDGIALADAAGRPVAPGTVSLAAGRYRLHQ